MTCDIPVAIDGDEKIVRGIFYPYHFDQKKQKLKPEAFIPPYDTDELSVIRSTYMRINFCKEKEKEIKSRGSPKNIYVGLACIIVSRIRDIGINVVDSRRVYCGHADIKTGCIVRKEEPGAPKDVKRRREIAKQLINRSIMHVDPNPSISSWQGSRLCTSESDV